MPEPLVREDIERGLLVRLGLPEYTDGLLQLHAIYRTDTPPGRAASWLIARFRAQAAEVKTVERLSRTARRRAADPFRAIF